jgi:hypothetical protein
VNGGWEGMPKALVIAHRISLYSVLILNLFYNFSISTMKIKNDKESHFVYLCGEG